MINFDYLILKEFLDENNNFLKGARLQKIQQPTRQELLFTMRNQGETKKFYININPKFFHLCFISEENQLKRFIEIPQKPPMFCMLLRKYLEAARISKIYQPDKERILEFYFETYNELSEKIYLCLAIELMGKHSNVVLYNYDTNVIIGSAHNVGADKSREREIIGGLPYAYPLKNNNKNFSGLSSLLNSGESVSQFIDNYFANLQEEEKIKAIKSKLLTSIKTKLRKTDSTLAKIQKQSTTIGKANVYRKKADLIMSNLGINTVDKNFSSSIEIIDYETNLPIKIDLDKAKTLKENANQYYKLYNKAKISYLKTNELTVNLYKEKEYLEQVLYSIESSNNIKDLLEIEEEIKETKEKLNNKPIKINITPLSFQISDFTVFVGKNNKQNDYIISKLAKDEDFWFHVHNMPGSHVLLKIQAGQKLDDKIIFECAKLAKQYSAGKNSSKVGVIYTKRKNLKKPSGAKLGYVIYKNEKEIIID